MDPVDTITYKNHTIQIFPDDCAESPRDWDNLCEFHCCHRRYSLGDKNFNTLQDQTAFLLLKKPKNMEM